MSVTHEEETVAIDTGSKGGNFLLNVGPDATGTIPAPSIERLREIGTWLKRNGEAVYGTQGGPFPRRLDWGRTTIRKRADGGTTLFAHVWQRPADGRILLPGVPERPVSARMLAGGMKVSINSSSEGVLLQLPEFSDDSPVTVAAVEFPAGVTTNQRITGPGPDGTITLGALEAALTGPDDGTHPLRRGRKRVVQSRHRLEGPILVRNPAGTTLARHRGGFARRLQPAQLLRPRPLRPHHRLRHATLRQGPGRVRRRRTRRDPPARRDQQP